MEEILSLLSKALLRKTNMSNIKFIKTALAVNDVNDIQALLEAQSEGDTTATITAHLYDRAFCDADSCVGTGIVQPIPYVVIYAFNPTNSEFSILTYTRPAKNTEQRLSNKTSIGFGGHIDSDIQGEIVGVSEATDDAPHDVTKPLVSYKMLFADLIQTLNTTAIREVKEEIGLDITELLNSEFHALQPYFFQESPQSSDNVGKVHLAYCVPCRVESKAALENFLLDAKAQEKEIEGMTITTILTSAAVPMVHRLSSVNSLDINVLVDDFCSSLTSLSPEELQSVSNIFFAALERSFIRIVQETSMENWSKIAFSAIAHLTFSGYFGHGFEHVYKLIMENQTPVQADEPVQVEEQVVEEAAV